MDYMDAKSRILSGIFLLFFLAGGLFALGQDEIEGESNGLTSFYILNLPLGGEYEGMGTAYTAVGRDASYFDANPAASSSLERTELSMVHNDWIADSDIESVVYTQRKENLGIGVGAKIFHVPFNTLDEWGDQVYLDSKAARGRYSQTVAGFNISYNFLSSFDFGGIAAGSNIKLAYTNLPGRIYGHRDDVGNQSSFMGMIDFGLLTRFNFLKFYPSREGNFSIGAAFRNLGPPVKREPLPTRFDAGIAYSPFRPVLLSFDINYPISLQSGVPAENPGIAAGIALKFTDFLTTTAGFLIKGANPRLSVGSSILLDRMSLDINYTVDKTTQFKTIDRFSVQAKLDLGDFGREKLRKRIDDLYVRAIEAYRLGKYEQSIAFCNEGLSLDAAFTPFQEIKTNAERVIKNTNAILELQELGRQE
jgi:hypothetical protein